MTGQTLFVISSLLIFSSSIHMPYLIGERWRNAQPNSGGDECLGS